MNRRFFPPHKAKVEIHDGNILARQPNGTLWVIPPVSVSLEHGETILITIPKPDTAGCVFIRKAPELAS